jgi:hypothetical protein
MRIGEKVTEFCNTMQDKYAGLWEDDKMDEEDEL